MQEMRGCDLMQGTIRAGDGLVVAITSLSTFDLVSSKVRDVTKFRRRKGCFAVVVQAFCDAFGQYWLKVQTILQLTKPRTHIISRVFAETFCFDSSPSVTNLVTCIY